MAERQPATVAGVREPDWRSRSGPLVQLASVLFALLVIVVYVELRKPRSLPPAPAPAAPEPRAESVATEPSPEPAPDEPEPAEPAAPAARPLDRAALARAEAELDAAIRDRERSEARALDAAKRLALAQNADALATLQARKLAFQIHDPSTRVARASSRGGFLRGERDKLAREVSTLKNIPRPKLKSILTKSPVSRPAMGNEVHFELRKGRASFINIDRLVDLTKADAQVRLRMADRVPIISGRVGPVGSFSLSYELARATPGTVEELLERKSMRFDLQAWQVEPETELRGETFEATRGPLSEFSRVMNRMNPERSTVTLWVYPDSFTLYRQLREDLSARGFSVAGRPLPEGMAIRGSPMGSQSAAQ